MTGGMTEAHAAAPSATPTAFTAALAAHVARTEAMLEHLLPQPDPATSAGERELREAMRYGVLGGGKRLRAFLCLETALMFGAPLEAAARVAAAFECLHAYSLIHDDLPCMDDDDLRRGRPTVHRAFSETTAVLAGDALQTLAFEILADPATHASGTVRARLCLRLAQASGVAGMVGGQALDLAAERAGHRLDGNEVRRLQALKTGALIEASAEAGAILAETAEADIARIRAYARALGEAFQIADDLLDATGTEAETGKRVGKDAEAGKATFLDLLGLDGARRRAGELVEAARDQLTAWPGRADRLAEAAEFAVARRS